MEGIFPLQRQGSNLGCVNIKGDENQQVQTFRESARPGPGPGPAASQGVRAGPGTLRHPNLDKIFTKWVAIKDLDAA